MNPVLYAKNTVDFSNLGLGTLGEAISCVVSEKINDYFTLDLEYPQDGVYADLLEVDNIIAASVKGYALRQLFRIARVEKKITTISVSAEHISYQLKGIPVTPFTASSASGAMGGILSHSIGTNPFDFNSDVTSGTDFTFENPQTIRRLLLGEDGIAATYGAEVLFNNYHVRLVPSRGGTADTSFEYGKNIRNINNTISIEELVTSICPFYHDENNFIMLSEGYLDCATASNYSYRRIIVVDMTSEFTDQETPSEALLRTKAQAYLNSLSIGFPTNGIGVTPIILSDFEGYENLIENIEIGDTVVVTYAPMNLSYTDRITAYEWEVIQERYKSVTIGDNGKTFADYVLEGDTNYIGGGRGVAQIIDSAMSDVSINAVMNKVIKAYVDGQIATRADKAFARITVGTTNIDADSKADTLTLIAGTNVTLTPDAANDSITISASGGGGGYAYREIGAGGQNMPADSTEHFTITAGTGISLTASTGFGQKGVEIAATVSAGFDKIIGGGGSLVASDGQTVSFLEGHGIDITINTSSRGFEFAVDETKMSTATTSSAGLMSASDKTKLNGIESGAEVNQNAFSNVTVGTQTIQADGKTDTLTLTEAGAITLTPNTSTDSVEIFAPYAFSNITVGTQTIAADSKADTFELKAGSGISLTANTSNDQITIYADGSNMWFAETSSVQGSIIMAESVTQSTYPFVLNMDGVIFLRMNEDNLPSGNLFLALDSNDDKKLTKDSYGTSVTKDDLAEGNIYIFKYNGTYYILQDSIIMSGGVNDVVVYDVPQNIGTSIVNSNGVARIPKTGNSNWGLVKAERGTEPPTLGLLYLTRMSSTTEDPVPLITADFDNGTMRPSVMPLANTIDRGAMSPTDKSKLDGIASGAEVNQNAFSNITVGTATISADSKTDTLTLTAGTNITLTANTSNDSVTISASGGGGGVTDVLAYDEDGTTFSVVVGGNATIPKAGSTYGGVAIQTQNDAIHLYWNGSNKWIPTLTGPYGTINASWMPWNAIYPIGSIFETTDESADPSQLFGGTWQLLGQFVTDNGTELTTSEGLLFADGFGSVKQTYKWERIAYI